jgi:hypothetical protein
MVIAGRVPDNADRDYWSPTFNRKVKPHDGAASPAQPRLPCWFPPSSGALFSTPNLSIQYTIAGVNPDFAVTRTFPERLCWWSGVRINLLRPCCLAASRVFARISTGEDSAGIRSAAGGAIQFSRTRRPYGVPWFVSLGGCAARIGVGVSDGNRQQRNPNPASVPIRQNAAKDSNPCGG